MSDPKIRGAFRHLLSSFGPVLAAHGVMNELYWQSLVGIAMALLAFVDSWRAKEKQ